MKTKRVGKKTKITLTYFEWVELGKILPMPEGGFVIGGTTEYIIHKVPEDKKEFFESLGCRVVLANSIGGKMKHINTNVIKQKER